MISINIEDIAKAARITLAEEEKAAFAQDVAAILSLGDLLAEESEERSFHSDTLDLTHAKTALRADEPQESLSRDALLSLAPTSHDGFVTVPRVIADGEKKEGDA